MLLDALDIEAADERHDLDGDSRRALKTAHIMPASALLARQSSSHSGTHQRPCEPGRV